MDTIDEDSDWKISYVETDSFRMHPIFTNKDLGTQPWYSYNIKPDMEEMLPSLQEVYVLTCVWSCIFGFQNWQPYESAGC